MGAAIAKLLGSGNGLTNYGVQATPGGPTSYANPAQMGQLVGADSAAATAPGRSDMSGTITPPTLTSTQVGDTPAGGIGPMQDPAVSVTENPDKTSTPRFTAPPVGVQPTVTRPTFEQAQTIPGALTKGGVLASLLLPAITGAANGLSAMQVTNPHIQPGLGGAFAAGVNTPNLLKTQQNQLQAENLGLQKEQAQINSIPGQMQQQRALQTSEINRNNAMADRKDVFQAKDGSILERQSDGTMKTLYAAPSKPDAQDSVDGRQQIIAGLKSGETPYTLSNEQEQGYILTGKLPADPKDPNPNPSSLLLSAASGDKTAMKALQIQSNMEVQTHRGFSATSTDGLSAGLNRSSMDGWTAGVDTGVWVSNPLKSAGSVSGASNPLKSAGRVAGLAVSH